MKKHNADYGAIQQERSTITQSARNLAEKRRQKSPYSVEKQGEFIKRLSDYVQTQQEAGKPLTVSGFILASGIPSRTWYHMKAGDFDAMIEEYKITHDLPPETEEYTTEDGEVLSLIPWSEVIDRCYLIAQEERETACVAGKAGNVIGNIFLLKAQHGLTDQPEMVSQQTNIQIVADAETAMKALEMCK